MTAYKKILNIAFRSWSKRFGIAEDFIQGIYEEESSWNFITRLAQLVEAISTHLLVQRLNEPKISRSIGRLSQAARIGLLADLGVVSRQQKDVFLTIAEMRNDYVHNIVNVEVTLARYLGALPRSRQNEVFKKFKPFLDASQSEIDLSSFVDNVKEHIFVVSALELVRISGSMEAYDAERRHKEYRRSQAEKLLPTKRKDEMYLDDRMKISAYVQNARVLLQEAELL